jgi:hypothetical protein
VLGILALVCLTLGLAGSAAAQCNPFILNAPDPDSLKLKDGEHVIASAAHAKGKLEVRVNVKGGVASEPQFFLGGKLLNKTPESKVAKPILDCLKKQLPPGGSISSSTDHIFDLFVQTAYARGCKPIVYGVECHDATSQCCALACCGNQCAIQCAYY